MTTKFNEQRSIARKAARRTACIVCDTLFTAARATRKFCSPQCRQALHHKGLDYARASASSAKADAAYGAIVRDNEVADYADAFAVAHAKGYAEGRREAFSEGFHKGWEAAKADRAAIEANVRAVLDEMIGQPARDPYNGMRPSSRTRAAR
jgi:hypothetical protein